MLYEVITESSAFHYTMWDNWLLCYDSQYNLVQAIRTGEGEIDEVMRNIIAEWSSVEIFE